MMTLGAESGAARPAGVLIESHIHLFADDPQVSVQQRIL